MLFFDVVITAALLYSYCVAFAVVVVVAAAVALAAVILLSLLLLDVIETSMAAIVASFASVIVVTLDIIITFDIGVGVIIITLYLAYRLVGMRNKEFYVSPTCFRYESQTHIPAKWTARM